MKRTRGAAEFGLHSAILPLRRILSVLDEKTYSRLVVPTIALLPATLAYGVALFRADLLFRWSSARKEIRRSIELLFGNRFSVIERDRISRDYFRYRSCEPIDSIRLLGRGKALLSLVKVRGTSHLKSSLTGGRGAVVCAAHIGSPKATLSLLGALGFPVTVVGRWSYGPGGEMNPVQGWLYSRSLHLHRANIERSSSNFMAAAQAAMILRQNEVVGIMIDAPVQPDDPSRPRLFDFLGSKIAVTPGATTLAQIAASPLHVVMLRRSGDWRHQELTISPPIYGAGDPVAAFEQCLRPLERAILESPGEWRSLWISTLEQLGLVSRGAVDSTEIKGENGRTGLPAPATPLNEV